MIRSAEEFVSLRQSEDRESYTRAAHDQASEEVWLEVIEKYPDMKKWVAHNKTVPLSVLRILAEDPDREVRCSVAEKRKLDSDLFRKLAHDPESTVRHRIAYNRKAPLEILQILVDDLVGFVAEAARERMAGAK